MKTIVKSVRPLLALFTFVLLFSSCSTKSEPDPLDQYVGTWTETTFNGKSSDDIEITISKSANGLVISDFTEEDFTAKLGSSGIEANNKNIDTGEVNQFPDSSTGALYLQNLTGSVTSDKLTFKYTLFAQGARGQLKLPVTHVFTKT